MGPLASRSLRPLAFALSATFAAAACSSSTTSTDGGADATTSPTDAAAGDQSSPPQDSAPAQDAPGSDSSDAGDSASPTDAADAVSPTDAADAAPTPMVLTSPTLTDRGRFPVVHTCTGANTSPALSWTAGPPGTLSYAIVFEDLTVPNMHWILYDIPAGVRSVAAALPFGLQPGAPAPSGSRQSRVTFSPTTFGYLGPCPPTGDHDYVFTVYALSAATVPGVVQSGPPEAIAAQIRAIKVNASSEASLSSKYMKP